MPPPTIAELERRREYECRLTPDRALESLDEAAAWLDERGMVTRTPDSSLPSFHLAMHEAPYAAGSRGFGSYPRTKYVWVFELARRADVYSLRIHRGNELFLPPRVARVVDPLARAALADAEAGAFGDDARRIVEHLAAAGPTLLEELKEELGIDAASLKKARRALEALAAVVAKSLVLESDETAHSHTSELRRWDQVFADPAPGGLEDLFVAGVAAAILAPEKEARGWFSWGVSAAAVDALADAGRIVRPAPGVLALPS